MLGYTATSFEFHAPSEHTIEGTQYDLEMQITHSLKVHKIYIKKSEFSSTATTAIVSIMF